MFISLIF